MSALAKNGNKYVIIVFVLLYIYKFTIVCSYDFMMSVIAFISKMFFSVTFSIQKLFYYRYVLFATCKILIAFCTHTTGMCIKYDKMDTSIYICCFYHVYYHKIFHSCLLFCITYYSHI